MAAFKTAIFDLNAATHVWTDENNPSVAFGGDDFNQPGASAAVMSHIAENSVNLGFLTGDFGPLATSTLAGNTYDIKLGVYNAGSPNLQTITHDVIALSS